MTDNSPIEKFSDGAAKASIFKSRNGDWLEVNLRRVYQKDGEWKSSSTYSLRDAKRAHNVLGQAIEFMEAQQRNQQNDDIIDSLVQSEAEAIAAE